MSDSKSNKILAVATGPYGLVGRGLWKIFPGLVPIDIAPPPADFPAPTISLPPADITDLSALANVLGKVASSADDHTIVLFHLAALTDTKGDQTDLFEKVNVLGTQNVLKACSAIGAKMVHISTDYVFEGTEKPSGSYTEDDRPSVPPKTAYSLSKFRAENVVLDQAPPNTAVVARIAFPYGMQGPRAGLAEKYLQKMAECRQTKQPMRLFNDQRICPSYIPDIVRGLEAIARKLASGDFSRRLFHLVGQETTPFDFGKLIQSLFDFGDVAIESSSVAGTRYSANLGLSTQNTKRSLSWQPTPHSEALPRLKK